MFPMRGTIGARLQNTNISNAARQTLVPFSTSSGGSGRGRGGSFSAFSERVPGKPISDNPKSDTTTESPPPIPPPGSGRGASFSAKSTKFNFTEESKSDTTESSPIHPPGSGRGHGRGNPVPPPSGFPSFSSFMASIKHQPSAGRGRGGGTGIGIGPLTPQPPVNANAADTQQLDNSEPKNPIFFKREDDGVSPTPTTHFSPPKQAPSFTRVADDNEKSDNSNRIQDSIPGLLNGMGRGKTSTEAVSDSNQVTQQENRHIRRRPADAASETTRRGRQQPILSRDDAVKKARELLSRDGAGAESGGGSSGRGSFSRGRGGRGRGRRGGFRGGDGDGRGGRDEDREKSYSAGLYAGDDADGEKLAKKVGPEIMNQLTEAFEEMISRVLPSPVEDEFVEAFDYNCRIEFEPEYAVEFDNPDIDEKEPMPLRDVLEKVKPFMMAYEGIQSQKEWEEIMEATMAQVPLLKKIVDHYSGPDRVTAKKQQGELERVAKTLPRSAPSTVNQFANRAVISLQSNPGWGFDRKCQFMDKLVREVSQHYK